MQEVVSRDTVVELERDLHNLTDVSGDVAGNDLAEEHVRIVRILFAGVQFEQILRGDLGISGLGHGIDAVAVDVHILEGGARTGLLVVSADVGVELALIEGILIGVELEVDIVADIDHTFSVKDLEDVLVHRLGLPVVVTRIAVLTGNVAVTRLIVELVDTEGILVLGDGDRLTVAVVGLEDAVDGDDSKLELVHSGDLVDLVPLEVLEVGEELVVLDGDILDCEGIVVSKSGKHESIVSNLVAFVVETVSNLDLERLEPFLLIVRDLRSDMIEVFKGETEILLELISACLVDGDRPDETDIVGIRSILVEAVVVDQSIAIVGSLRIVLVLVPVPSPDRSTWCFTL